MSLRDEIHEAMRRAAQDEAERIKRAARGRDGQPTEFAPAYAELNPLGITQIVHVITTLEA